MKFIKNDIRNIIIFYNKFSKYDIESLLHNYDKIGNDSFSMTLKKLSKLRNPVDYIIKINGSYNELKGGQIFAFFNPTRSSLDRTERYYISNLGNRGEVNNDQLLSNLLSKISSVVDVSDKHLRILFDTINGNPELRKSLKTYIENNIGLIEYSIGMLNDYFLNFLVKILDDYIKNTESRLNNNIFIIIYLFYKFLVSKYEYTIQPKCQVIIDKITNYLNYNSYLIFEYINKNNLLTNDNKILLMRNVKFTTFFMDYLINLMINNCSNTILNSLYHFIEDYEFIIPNSEIDLNIISSKLI
tara:strand:- start:342 stop:1241 length:900 start_codon:yes stop_codon:yes gene_type:complete